MAAVMVTKSVNYCVLDKVTFVPVLTMFTFRTTPKSEIKTFSINIEQRLSSALIIFGQSLFRVNWFVFTHSQRVWQHEKKNSIENNGIQFNAVVSIPAQYLLPGHDFFLMRARSETGLFFKLANYLHICSLARWSNT